MKILGAPQQGAKIEVMDMKQNQIGSGTFKSMYAKPKGNYTVYECDDGAIVVEGEHVLTVDGRAYRVSAPIGGE